MRKKPKKNLIVPKNAQSFFEHKKEIGFKGLLGFKNLVELLKNEQKKIKDKGENLAQIKDSDIESFSKKLSPEIVEDIASSYGYYFYYFLNSEQSPLSIEQSKAVCFYRVLKNIKNVSEQLEIDPSVCRNHLKKGVQVLLLESTFKNFKHWSENKTSDQKRSEISTLANVPISNLKQYLPKSLVFTLSTKGETLKDILSKYNLKELSSFKGMGKAKTELFINFLEENNLKDLVHQ